MGVKKAKKPILEKKSASRGEMENAVQWLIFFLFILRFLLSASLSGQEKHP